MENPYKEGFDEYNFVQNYEHLKLYYTLHIPSSNNFLHLQNYTFIS